MKAEKQINDSLKKLFTKAATKEYKLQKQEKPAKVPLLDQDATEKPQELDHSAEELD